MKEKSKKKIEGKEKEFEEMKALLQRTQADFANYRRRVEDDKMNFVKLASADVISQVLPILDNFALAAEHVPQGLENDSWVLGIQAIEKQLEQIMSANGLKRIDSIGAQFDPNLHEAISEVSDKKVKDNVIVSENMAGYLLNEKLLRPAKVIVNRLIK